MPDTDPHRVNHYTRGEQATKHHILTSGSHLAATAYIAVCGQDGYTWSEAETITLSDAEMRHQMRQGKICRKCADLYDEDFAATDDNSPGRDVEIRA